jgi:mono/diheme cytochrome c family protein
VRATICVMTAMALAVAPSAALANPTYAPPYQERVVVEKTKVIGVPVNAPYIFSVGNDGEESEDRIADKVVRRFKKEFDVNPGAEAAPAPPEAAGPVSREDFRLVGGGNAAAGLDGKVLALFNAQCVQCHKPGQTKPGAQLFTADRRLFVDPDPKKEAKRRQRINDACNPDAGGEMPKNRPPLTPAERRLINDWCAQAVTRHAEK